MNIHVFFTETYISLRVRIGATSRSETHGVQEIDVETIIKHENFEPEPSYNNDIGLLKLIQPFRNKSKPIFPSI